MRKMLLKIAVVTALAAGGLALLGNLPTVAQSGVTQQFQNGLSQAPSVYGLTSTMGYYFGGAFTGSTGHVHEGNLITQAPVITSCGTTPTLTTGSTDAAGTITMGTSATGCVITFGTAYSTAPACVVTWRATPLASQSYTTSTTALTLTQTSTSNNLADYVCRGRVTTG